MLDLIRSIVSGIARIISGIEVIAKFITDIVGHMLSAGAFILSMFSRIGQFLGFVFYDPYILSLLMIAIFAVVLYRIVGWN